MYWIKIAAPGRLAIGPRPLGGDDLADSIERWRKDGVDCVVRLLDAHEVHELGLTDQKRCCDSNAMRLIDFPIPDRGVPDNATAAIALAQSIERDIAAGQSVLIHCRAGIGRSALLAASVFVSQGMPADQAFAHITSARRVTVPDTDAQTDWVHSHARDLASQDRSA